MIDHLLAKLTTSGKKLSAQMVLMSPTEAFSVRVPPLPTYKYATGNVTPEFFIALPKNAEIYRAYVESYTIDGAPETQCIVEPVVLGRFAYSVIGLAKPDRDAIVTHAEQPDGCENVPHTVEWHRHHRRAGPGRRNTLYLSTGTHALHAG